MAKIPESERELVKNILHDVLKTRLKADLSLYEDNLVANIAVKIPGELLLIGTAKPTIERLEAYRSAIDTLLRETIAEIKHRNGGSRYL